MRRAQLLYRIDELETEIANECSRRAVAEARLAEALAKLNETSGENA